MSLCPPILPFRALSCPRVSTLCEAKEVSTSRSLGERPWPLPLLNSLIALTFSNEALDAGGCPEGAVTVVADSEEIPVRDESLTRVGEGASFRSARESDLLRLGL